MRGESKKTREIFVMVTNACNLACAYCYEHEKNAAHARIDAMKKVVADDITANHGFFNEYYLIFHGGEPFLAFDVIQALSEWVWNDYPELHFTCMVTTNGTRLTSRIKQWLANNRHRFVAILSIDGTPESHNLNRNDSYHLIDIDFFIQTWPMQPVKMTIAPNTLHQLFDNFMHLRNLGFIVNPSLAKEAVWNFPADLSVFAQQLRLLADYYLSRPDEMPCELINVPIQNFAPGVNLPHNRACGAGGNVVAYDVLSQRYPCHTFIGSPHALYDVVNTDQQFALLATNDGLLLSECCRDCFIYSYCSPCYGLNYTARGNMGNFDRSICEFNKVRALASAGMFASMSENPAKYKALSGMTDAVLRNLIAGIRETFSQIQIASG